MAALNEAELRRPRWHCRRGLLENDLVLDKFLGVYARDLDSDRLTRLNELLELGDNELWDLISARTEPSARHIEMVQWLRAC